MLYRDFETQAELDEQYDVESAVDDFGEYAAFFVEQSERAREDLDCDLDVPYGPTLAEHVDVFPADDPDAPMLLYIHGGYWHSLSSKEFSFVARGPVSAGVTTVVLNYALCPHVTIDEIVRQSRAAVAWLHDEADYGDADRIHVAGHSAGGHLTAMLLATDWEDEYGLPADVIEGACSISGLFDLEPFPYTWLQPKLQLTWGQVRRNSPIRHIPDDAPPLIVTYGDDEPGEMCRQSDDFLEAWREHGLDGTYLPQPGDNHFTAIEGFLDAESPLCEAIFEQMELDQP
ncbi:esterase [Halobacteriales archaeon QS_1_68_17]|nr:MAG: esterase [Halobacteriales archaeon QS_1_68_17]